jgi:hypothetical protein
MYCEYVRTIIALLQFAVRQVTILSFLQQNAVVAHRGYCRFGLERGYCGFIPPLHIALSVKNTSQIAAERLLMTSGNSPDASSLRVDQAVGPEWCGPRRGPPTGGRDRLGGAVSVARLARANLSEANLSRRRPRRLPLRAWCLFSALRSRVGGRTPFAGSPAGIPPAGARSRRRRTGEPQSPHRFSLESPDLSCRSSSSRQARRRCGSRVRNKFFNISPGSRWKAAASISCRSTVDKLSHRDFNSVRRRERSFLAVRSV